MKKSLLLLPIVLVALLYPGGAMAAEPLSSMRLKTDFKIWKVNLNRVDWMNDYSKLSWNGLEVKLLSDLDPLSSENALSYLQNNKVSGVDFVKVKDYLETVVAPYLVREKQDVTISMKNGKVVFEGFALHGQELDIEKSLYLIREAFKMGEGEIRLPIRKIQPIITVESDELKEKGIVELLSTGETDFAGSPYNRRVNIKIGLASFSGNLIAPGEGSGAGDMLGYIGPETGYLKELVIKGDKTIPEYGGGLCQVSTTVYRSLLFAGLPITQRRNHSYAVSYYDPQGLDATIYPPAVDMKFKNDTSAHILLQATTIGNKAYSNVYGTPVDRQVDLIGPYYYSYRRAPPAKVEYTSELAPGQKKSVGGAHTGFKADWYRRISYADGDKEDVLENIHSNYAARPQYTLIGEDKPVKPVASSNGT